MTLKNIYYASISPIPEGGGFFGKIPDISGCITTGRTIEETILNLRDASNACLCVLEDEGENIPSPSPVKAVSPKEIIAAIDVDTVAYRMETDTRSVRKNVSMPAWMSNLAEKRGINCSSLLQEALRQKLNI